MLRQIRSRLEQGELPAAELVDGVLILVAGALMLTPGFVTDAVGLLLAVPADPCGGPVAADAPLRQAGVARRVGGGSGHARRFRIRLRLASQHHSDSRGPVRDAQVRDVTEVRDISDNSMDREDQ